MTNEVELIVKVIEAARAVTNGSTQNLVPLMDAVDELDAALAYPAVAWVKATWADVATGDTVRLPAGSGYAQAEVESVMPLHWVGSGADQIKVTLSGRPKPYAMSPCGQVEVMTPAEPEMNIWAQAAYRSLRESFDQVEKLS